MVAKSEELDNSSSPDSEAAAKPVLVILAGAPGAGKTTFYEGKLKAVFPTNLRASSSPLEQTENNQERSRLQKEQESFVPSSTRMSPWTVRSFHEGELVKLARSVPKWAQKVFGKEFDKWLSLQDRGHGRTR